MKKVSNSDVTVIIPTLNEGIAGVSMKEFSKVLVTGGAGFVGSHLVDCLMGMGCFVRVVTRAETKRVKLIRHQSRTLNEEIYEGGAS